MAEVLDGLLLSFTAHRRLK